MPYITGTEVPYLALFTCPRCKASSRPLIPQAPGVNWRCGGCEWLMTASQIASPAAPGVPASNTPVSNTSGTVVAVNVTGGTVTAINVNGVATGQTSGIVLVPVGGNVSITYSVAPGWTWALPGISAGTSAGATALPFTAFGTAYAAGQILVVDGGAVAELCVVTGAPSSGSVPVSALANAHTINTTVSVASFAPTLAQDAVPNAPGWGF